MPPAFSVASKYQEVVASGDRFFGGSSRRRIGGSTQLTKSMGREAGRPRRMLAGPAPALGPFALAPVPVRGESEGAEGRGKTENHKSKFDGLNPGSDRSPRRFQLGQSPSVPVAVPAGVRGQGRKDAPALPSKFFTQDPEKLGILREPWRRRPQEPPGEA